MKSVKIFGQEPAFLVGVIEAGLSLFLVMGWLDWSQEQAAVTVACVSAGLGLVVAYATSTTLYSALIGFAKAFLVLCAAFGADLNDAKTASVMALITLLAGVFLRQTSNSNETALSSASPGAKREALQLFALQAAAQSVPTSRTWPLSHEGE